MKSICRSIDYWMRRAVAWPLILIGAAVVMFGGGCIVAGAWIADVDTGDGE